jgi:nitrite reductase/ring-hydroxylating ferredoxin subunit
MTGSLPAHFPLLAAADLAEGQSREIALPRDAAGEPVSLLLVRHQGHIHAYRNQCPHQRVPLNWRPNGFWNFDHTALLCAMHGALFEPATCLCIYGPCHGRSLQRVPLEEREGMILLAEG